MLQPLVNQVTYQLYTPLFIINGFVIETSETFHRKGIVRPSLRPQPQ